MRVECLVFWVRVSFRVEGLRGLGFRVRVRVRLGLGLVLG